MPKKNSTAKKAQPPEPETLPSGEVALYHLIGVWMPEFGFARPDEPAYLPSELAAGYIESDPSYWSYAAFAPSQTEVQKKTSYNEASVSDKQGTEPPDEENTAKIEASSPANRDAKPTEVKL